MRIRTRKITAVIEDELWPSSLWSWERVMGKARAIILPQGGMFTGPDVGIGLEIHTDQFLDGDRLFGALRRVTRRLKRAGIVDQRSDWYLLGSRIYVTDDWKIVLTLESEYED